VKPIDPNNPGYRLAMLIQSIEFEKRNFDSAKKDHNARLETLHQEVWKLRQQIITGQEELPLEPVPPPAEPPTEQHA
jgi:hypothetical protein